MSKMRARYHELVAQMEEKNRQFVELREAHSKALIDGATFTDGEKLRPLEDEIHALAAAIITVAEQARVEEIQAEANAE